MRVNEFYTYFAAFTCNIGAISVTSHIGFTSPTQKELIDKNILNSYTLPIFASIGILTRMIATLILPMLVHFNISINTLIIIHCLVGWTGWMLVITAESAVLLIIGVALVGYYTGIAVVFIFTYIPEIALDNQRRVLSGAFGFVVRIGMFLAFLFGIWIPFRWLAVVGIIQICMFCILLTFLPTSPVQLIARGLDDRARNILVHLHGRNVNVEKEIRKIKLSTVSKDISLREYFQVLTDWKCLKPFLTILMLGFFKEFGGHIVMISFSTKILETQQAMDAKVAALFYPTFLIAGAIVCICLLNRCKMKWLIIVASSLQAISHLSMSIYYLIIENHSHCLIQQSSVCHLMSIWPTFNIALFAFAFALGWGLVYFSLMGLMLTVHREFSSAISDAVSNLSAYLMLLVFYYMLINIGGFATFLMFSILRIIAIIFVYFAIKI
ncbi:hypothetical protein LOD99_13105 [Oopsacas minuta]|uniref:Uncharacterized protein n=1 Tax=Oopsacas minuta TaxID=111878 RepID=A0AAV7JB01_9METZ|nr:hypothetical protein LOD99_13105 [Oopsacas minuta]